MSIHLEAFSAECSHYGIILWTLYDIAENIILQVYINNYTQI